MQQSRFVGPLGRAIAILLALWLALAPAAGWGGAGRVAAAGCPVVPNTPFFTYAYGAVQQDGNPALAGTIIEALNPRGDIVGCFEVTSPGSYGAMPVYGEDSSASPTIPGMRDGETVAFRVGGIAAASTPRLVWHNDWASHQADLDSQSPRPLDPPSNLAVSPTSQTRIELAWTDNSTDETAFHIERSDDAGLTWSAIGISGANISDYADNGLVCGTTYHYRVRAYRDADGQVSAYSAAASGTTHPCATQAVEVRVSQAADDAEEEAGTGNIALGSSDLELTEDGAPQTVGLRFRNVEVPKGANITSAYLVFAADETSRGATDLTFHGQASDSAPAFSRDRGDISSRPRTAAAVDWNDVPPWDLVHATHQTPDLAPIVQEIVSRSGWSAGRALVIIVTGTGKRVAESCNGDPDLAPVLHVEYAGELACYSLSTSADPPGSGSVSASPAPNCGTGRYAQGTPVQLTASPSPGYAFSSWSGDLSGSDNPATLVIDSDSTATATFAESGLSGSVDLQVAAYTDDTEERLDTHAVQEKGADLELGEDSVPQIVGIRFQDVQIPPGAAITRATLTFAADEAHTGPTNLVIRGQASDDAAPFSDADGSLSSLPKTLSSANWNDVAPWSTIHEFYESPDLSAIIQEIVSRPGWTSGNALALFVSGSGRRTAEAFDSEPELSPRLHVEFGSSAPTCFALTLSHTGSGADPTASPESSPGCPAGQYLPGASVSLTASPEAGWTVSGWSGTSDDTSTATANQLTMPASSHSAAVIYAQATCFALTLSHTGSGADPTASPESSPGCPAGQYLPSASVSLTASPEAGWTVSGWSGTGDDTSTATANQLTMPASSHSARVDYVETSARTIDAAIVVAEDDAEERLRNGTMVVKGSDLELVEDTTLQTVGLRFQGLDIPQGATVTNAYVTFAADEVHSGDTSLTFHGQAADHALPFSEADRDISSRPTTASSVDWSHVPPWSTVHATYQSPNLAPILQEIVNRPGWSSGNALVLIVTGSGRRVAEAYDGDAGMAPVLHVELSGF